MSPTHIIPLCAKSIVLIKQVINSILTDKSIGIIHPAIDRRKMHQWMQLFRLWKPISLLHLLHKMPPDSFLQADGSPYPRRNRNRSIIIHNLSSSKGKT